MSPAKFNRVSATLRRLARTAGSQLRQPADAIHAAKRAVSVLAAGGWPALRLAVEREFGRRADFGGAPAYAKWIASHDAFSRRQVEDMRARAESLATKPRISLLMLAGAAPAERVRESVESLREQAYPYWELCIADDASDPTRRDLIERYREIDPRIKALPCARGTEGPDALNAALALAGGDWIAVLSPDSLLAPHALYEVALELIRSPDAEIVYSDEDSINAGGKRRDPWFKPDFSRELFRSQNYLGPMTVHRTRNVREAGGWRPGFGASHDYDLNLRIFETIDAGTIRHIPKVLHHRRAEPASPASSADAAAGGLRALQAHVDRLKLPATVEQAPATPHFRLRFSVSHPAPLVSLIIPTRDRAALLRQCINSILDKTDYDPFEIIVVDNGSVERETFAYLDELKARPNLRVLRYEKPFNYSAINNFGVAQAKGSIVGLINNDIEVISPGWLGEMVSWAKQPDVGCVGAKLYYPDGRIQHAGLILGIGGVAGHGHKYFPREHPGYFSRLKLVQNVSAVTGACLLVRKDIYLEVGGLNEKELPVAFNDVDFCLKVGRAGYLNVWTPFAELYHHESASRGLDESPEKRARLAQEARYMKEHWDLGSDPYYSIHLTRHWQDFSVE